MKKSFKPQLKNYFWLNRGGYYICYILIFIMTIGFILEGQPKSLVLGCFIFCILLQHIVLYYQKKLLSYWDDNGYEKIEIDTCNKMISFDDKIKLPATCINNATLRILIPPTPIYSLRMYPSLILNSELILTLNDGEMASIAIHFRRQAKKIMKLLEECNIKCEIDGDIDDVEQNPYLIPVIIFAVFGLIVSFLSLFYHR